MLEGVKPQNVFGVDVKLKHLSVIFRRKDGLLAREVIINFRNCTIAVKRGVEYIKSPRVPPAAGARRFKRISAGVDNPPQRPGIRNAARERVHFIEQVRIADMPDVHAFLQVDAGIKPLNDREHFLGAS